MSCVSALPVVVTPHCNLIMYMYVYCAMKSFLIIIIEEEEEEEWEREEEKTEREREVEAKHILVGIRLSSYYSILKAMNNLLAFATVEVMRMNNLKLVHQMFTMDRQTVSIRKQSNLELVRNIDPRPSKYIQTPYFRFIYYTCTFGRTF